MALRSEYAPAHAELDPFLFADVGDDAGGVRLTVLSLLARLGLDPRTEAHRLSMLPDGAAASALTSSIEALPGGGWSAADARVMAVRLLEHLPNRRRRTGDNASAWRSFTPGAIAPRWVIWIVASCLFLVAIWSMQGPSANSVMTFGAASSQKAVLAAISERKDGPQLVYIGPPPAEHIEAAA